jgi:hypothetical protein
MIVDSPDELITMSQLFDRYLLEIASKKALLTYKTNQIEIQTLRVALAVINAASDFRRDTQRTLPIS